MRRKEEEILWESVRIASKKAEISQQFLFFKGNIKDSDTQRWLYDQLFSMKRSNVVGLYRENALNRCICMVRDCFDESKRFGESVFAENGTQSNLCFKRRVHPEIKISVKFTDITGCINESLRRQTRVRNKRPSFSSESLFLFENMEGSAAIASSADHWMAFLTPMMKETLNKSVIIKVLQEHKEGGARSKGSQSNHIYNFEDVKQRLEKTEFKKFLEQ